MVKETQDFGEKMDVYDSQGFPANKCVLPHEPPPPAPAPAPPAAPEPEPEPVQLVPEEPLP